jgi:hypothetical protein
MSACFIVRAQVVDAAIKEDFDRWYQDEHLPDALKAFGAQRAWRGWSDMASCAAVYEFDGVYGANSGSDALKDLVKFDRVG